ncbi:carbamate kinase [Gordonia phosphorivorans]|uniref:Carbamate kinase n=1 Tax=Gordonia phosphorivorans TaxID=1056982 RepID=A0ABV6H3F6_9ACTN
MRVVVALGGNALLPRGEPLTQENQVRAVSEAMEVLAPVSVDHHLVITHGNGPQVGMLANLSAGAEHAQTFDVLDAQTEGMIGYLIERELRELLPAVREVATLVTLIEVDPKDPAFANPTKFIGPVYSKDQAEQLAAERGWVVKEDGQYWRRVVPSPSPAAIPGISTINRLLREEVTVVCAGGGGIPVAWDAVARRYSGVEAVIDKDLATSLLAYELSADLMVIATDVEGVYENWGTPEQKLIATAHPKAFDTSAFPAGSMGPKVAAAIEFVERGLRGEAVIGSLSQLAEILDGTAGTRVGRQYSGITYR